MKFVGIIAGLILLAAVLDRILRLLVIPRICEIFENMPPFNVEVEPPSEIAEPISISTADGLQLTGSVIFPQNRPPRGLVLFFPELNGNHAMSLRYCAGALDAGFALLGFDFRNQGTSGHQLGYTPIHWVTEYEMQDVAAVLEFVESHGELAALPLLAFGVSRGGVAALTAAGRYPRIRGVIADSSFSTAAMARHYVDRFASLIIPGWLYRILPEYHVRHALRDAMHCSERRRNCRYVHLENEVSGLADVPVLIISGTRDSYVKPEIAQHLQRICGPQSELWLVDEAKHNMARTVCRDEYDRRVAAHFCRAVRGHVQGTGGTARDSQIPAPAVAR